MEKGLGQDEEATLRKNPSLFFAEKSSSEAGHDFGNNFCDEDNQPQIDERKPHPAGDSGQQPPDVCGLKDAEALDSPVNRHRKEQADGQQKRRMDKEEQDRPHEIPDNHAEAPGADEHLPALHEKAALGHLVAAEPSAEFHRLLPAYEGFFLRLYAFHLFPHEEQTQ